MADAELSQEERWKLYTELCHKYRDGAAASIQEFDRAILTLSAGTLGLSLAFIKDIVPLRQTVYLPLLYTSWGCFGASIVLTLASFVASQKAFRRSETIAYEYYIEQKPERANKAGRVTRYLTYAAGALFIGGMVMTLLFTIVNISSLSAILKTSKFGGVTVTEKAVPVVTGNDVQKGVDPAGVIKVPSPPPVIVPPTPVPQAPPAAPQKK